MNAKPTHSISPVPRLLAKHHGQNEQCRWQSIFRACHSLWSWSAEPSSWLSWAGPEATQLHYHTAQNNIYLLIVFLGATSCRARGIAGPELTPRAPRAPWLPDSSQWQISQSHLTAFPCREMPGRCAESILLSKSQQEPTCQDFQLHFISPTCKGEQFALFINSSHCRTVPDV